MDTADLTIVYRDPAALVGDKRNTRLHTPEQVRAIRRSIDTFGFTNPILLRDEQNIGAGHARALAALLEPALVRVPTVIVPGLTKTQWRMYVIADNRLAEVGSNWDLDLLKNELLDLEAAGEIIAITGFSDEDLAKLIKDSPAPEDFPQFDEDIDTEYECPMCHYRFSGQSTKVKHDDATTAAAD